MFTVLSFFSKFFKAHTRALLVCMLFATFGNANAQSSPPSARPPIDMIRMIHEQSPHAVLESLDLIGVRLVAKGTDGGVRCSWTFALGVRTEQAFEADAKGQWILLGKKCAAL